MRRAIDQRLRQFMPQDRPLALLSSAFGLMVMKPDYSASAFEVEGDAAIVDVQGPIGQHQNYFSDSYDEIADRVSLAAESSAKAIVLRIDSPGGEALGMIECARTLRATCEAAGKPLYAFVDGQCCSAAYALSTAAQTIMCPPAGIVGSVGVFQPVVDATAADRAMGLTIRMISSGARKLDGNPHSGTTEDAVEDVKTRVLGLADLFFALVAEMRPSATVEGIKALEGATFLGAEAKSVGLTDAVGSWTDLMTTIANATAPSARAMETAMADEEKEPEDKKASARKAFFSAMEKAFTAAFGDDEPTKEEDGEEEKKKEAKDSEEEMSRAEEEEEEKEKETKAKASASTGPDLFAMAKRIQTLEAERAKEKRDIEISKLFAKRPDFDASIRATLESMPIERVREAVETWPRIGPVKLQAVAMPSGTRGESQTSTQAQALDEGTLKAMDRAMGIQSSEVPVSYGGGIHTMGFMTPEQARSHRERLAKGEVK